MRKKIIFTLGGVKLAECILADYEEIESQTIFNGALFQAAVRRRVDLITVATLKNIFDRLLSSDRPLKEYVDYYSIHYFYSPYQKNLGINIEDI